MVSLKMISEKIDAWRRYREAVRELSQFSDRELSDIGIRRCDIEDIVRRTGPRRPAADQASASAPVRSGCPWRHKSASAEGGALAAQPLSLPRCARVWRMLSLTGCGIGSSPEGLHGATRGMRRFAVAAGFFRKGPSQRRNLDC